MPMPTKWPTTSASAFVDKHELKSSAVHGLSKQAETNESEHFKKHVGVKTTIFNMNVHMLQSKSINDNTALNFNFNFNQFNLSLLHHHKLKVVAAPYTLHVLHWSNDFQIPT